MAQSWPWVSQIAVKKKKKKKKKNQELRPQILPKAKALGIYWSIEEDK